MELTKELRKQRVEIARDVIAQLLARKFAASLGTYARLYFDDPALGYASRVPKKPVGRGKSVDASRVIRAAVRCEVCARGAVILAAIDRFNSLKTPNSVSAVYDIESEACQLNYSNRFFDADEMLDMERIFERSVLNEWVEPWTDAYPLQTDRLDAIMRNIIKHRGEFRRDVVPPPRRRPLSVILHLDEEE